MPMSATIRLTELTLLAATAYLAVLQLGRLEKSHLLQLRRPRVCIFSRRSMSTTAIGCARQQLLMRPRLLLPRRTLLAAQVQLGSKEPRTFLQADKRRIARPQRALKFSVTRRRASQRTMLWMTSKVWAARHPQQKTRPEVRLKL